MIKPRDYEDKPETMVEWAKRDCVRAKKVIHEINKSLPKNINFEYSFSYWEKSLGVHLYSPREQSFSAEETRQILVWATENYGKPERNIRKEIGNIYYTFDDKNKNGKYRDYYVDFFIGNVDPLNCQIKKVTKKVTQYEAVCEGENNA